MGTGMGKVFISCGQRTSEEKALGEEIQELVRELTPFEPYFAEYQTTLDGLTKNIFNELYGAIGFITIMHRRGEIDPGQRSRASVWVEQEIAIAAFIQGILNKEIHVLALTEPGIELEGVRAQLLLNPVEFTTNEEALAQVRSRLASWSARELHNASLELVLKKENKKRTGERHDYDWVVEVKNTGGAKINEYHVDIEFPKAVLSNAKFAHEIEARSSRTHLFLRSPLPSQMESIYPGDSKPILRLNYHVDDLIYGNEAIMNSPVQARLYDSEGLVEEKSLIFHEIQEF